MPDSQPMTPAEMTRSLARIERAQTEMTNALSAQNDALRRALEDRPTWRDLDRQRDSDGKALAHELDVLKAHDAATQQRMQDLEDTQTWAMRIIVGAVILAILGLVLVENGGM